MLDVNQLKKNTARLSVMSNLILVLLKFAVGIFSGAVSIISEAAHSGVDLVAALVAFYAVKKSGEPPDKHHEYGHGKIENLSGVIEAMLIILAAGWIIFEAIGKLLHPSPPAYLDYGMIVMMLSMVVNMVVSGRLIKVAKQTRSQALEADGLHLRTDIWTSAGVLLGLIIIQVTGDARWDPVIAMAVAAIVLQAGLRMTIKSVYELTDISLPKEEEAIIRCILHAHPAVLDFHRLRTRRSGNQRLIDFHVILGKDMHLDKAHGICDEIESAIEIKLKPCDVVIHIEPCDAHKEAEICALCQGGEGKC